MNQQLTEIIDHSTVSFSRKQINDHNKHNYGLNCFGYGLGENPSDENFEVVNMIFADVLVDKTKANDYRSKLIKELQKHYSANDNNNYKELGENLKLDEDDTIRLMALGDLLHFWHLTSGKSLGFDEEGALELAKKEDYLFVSGFYV